MTANDLADAAGIASNTSDGYSSGSTWTGYSATSIADSKFEDSNSNANDVLDNAACFDSSTRTRGISALARRRAQRQGRAT